MDPKHKAGIFCCYDKNVDDYTSISILRPTRLNDLRFFFGGWFDRRESRGLTVACHPSMDDMARSGTALRDMSNSG